MSEEITVFQVSQLNLVAAILNELAAQGGDIKMSTELLNIVIRGADEIKEHIDALNITITKGSIDE